MSALDCSDNRRRDAVRAREGLYGLDEIEVRDRQLFVTMLGRSPEPVLERTNVVVRGGVRVVDPAVERVDQVRSGDPGRDDVLVVTLVEVGDPSEYELAIVDGADRTRRHPAFDPWFASKTFRFRTDCPTDEDCAPPVCGPAVSPRPAPPIDYTARDYVAVRQLLFDRLAVTLPDWRERHVPDLGVSLVELFAYVVDRLNYRIDAVATEAYLDTARQRISVRRHGQLLGYELDEGRTARAVAVIAVDLPNVAIDLGQLVLATAPPDGAARDQRGDRAGRTPLGTTWFEVVEPAGVTTFHAAHDTIAIYTWADRSCCLPVGATEAWLTGELALRVGELLVFEEVKGPRTGLAVDADRTHRHVVRLTDVAADEDPIDGQPLVRVRWSDEDALPFALCLSVLDDECNLQEDVSVARGNVVVVDQGRLVEVSPPAVAGDPMATCCDDEGEPGDVVLAARPWSATLASPHLAFRSPVGPGPAAALWDPAVPTVAWMSIEGTEPGGRPEPWQPRAELASAGVDDAVVAVELDDDGLVHLRTARQDGRVSTGGRAPSVGTAFHVRYRTTAGAVGNVPAESLVAWTVRSGPLPPITSVRNPLPARLGSEPETVEHAKQHIPVAARSRPLERAVTAADYAEIARSVTGVARAACRLEWTGVTFEAHVFVDEVGTQVARPATLDRVERTLEAARRIGHDVRVSAAALVGVDIDLLVCAAPGAGLGAVRAALRAAFASTDGPAGPGWFSPDRWTFGQPLAAAALLARAGHVPGVASVTVRTLRRSVEAPTADAVVDLVEVAPTEIITCVNDPIRPDQGRIVFEIVSHP